MAYDTGNIPALMELVYKRLIINGDEQDRIAVVSVLDTLARQRGIDATDIQKALYQTDEGPVFYYP